MAKKRQKASEGGANWQDTYGDMVTLLLCFFVLLYSISTVDQAKWIQVVKSFNPDAKEVSQIALDPESMAQDEVPGNVDDELDAFDSLYEKLQASVEEMGMTSDIELYKGDGYTFVTFRDTVFFDGDSSVIKPQGREILDVFSTILGGAADSIKEIRVLGHTSQAHPDYPNDIESDRVLSSERAAKVTAHIQMNGAVTADKMISEGYGQFRPIAPFDTRENRAKNRRVELLITKSDAVERSLEEYYEQMNR